MSEDEAKKALETAIGKMGRSFDVLTKDVEKISGLTEEMVERGFRHLARLLEAARQRAHFVRQVGGFSLDAPEEPSPVMNWQVGPQSAVTEGRLVGQGRPGAAARAPRAPIDDPDANSFLDDEE